MIKEVYEKRKQEGLCVHCGKPTAYVALGLSTMCNRCKLRKSEQQRARYQAYKASGICVICNFERARPGKVTCEKCAKRQQERYLRKVWGAAYALGAK